VTSEQIGYIFLAGLVSAGIGYAIATVFYRTKLNSLNADSNSLINEAKAKAEKIIKDAELLSKEDSFRRKEELNKSFESIRLDLRDQEKRLEKREDAIEDKARDMLKRERLTEVLQNQLQDRKNETDIKNKKFAEILEMKTGHHIIACSIIRIGIVIKYHFGFFGSSEKGNKFFEKL